MKKIFFSLIVIGLISCNDEQGTPTQNESNQQTEKKAYDGLYDQIDSLNNGFFNGMATAVVNADGVIHSKGFGWADVQNEQPYTINTQQPIASISKTFIGVSLLIAKDEGLLELDDPINDYLPFEVVNPSFPDQPITIRHLATHTSSIIDTDDYLDKSYILYPGNEEVNFENIPQHFNPSDSVVEMKTFLTHVLNKQGKLYSDSCFTDTAPGAMFNYSNLGATLAAYIIEEVSGQTYAEFTHEHVFAPLKMNQTGWTYDELGKDGISTLYSDPNTELPPYYLITYPDGGVITSISDLSLYMIELIKGYKGEGRLLSPESYEELFSPQLEAHNFEERNESNPYFDEYNTGIFMGMSGVGYIGHTGGDPGITTMMFFDPLSGIGRILLINTNIQSQEGVNAFFGIFDALGQVEESVEE